MTGASERPPTMSSLMALLLLLLLPVVASSTGTTDECLLNQYEAVPGGYRLEDDILIAGIPERRYLSSQYRRRTDGPGYEICSCVHKPCVIKCCPMGKLYIKKCELTNETLVVPKFVTKNGSVEVYGKDEFHIFYSKMNYCKRVKLIPSKDSADNFGITKYGWLMDHSQSQYTAPGQFCLDRYTKNDSQMIAMVCQTETKGTNEKGLSIFYIMTMIISLPFLLLTFLVYALIKKLRNLHGKSLMCHVAALTVGYTSLIGGQFTNNLEKRNVCILIGFIIQFSFLASFFWLNVMCFDLWWTFSGFRPLKGNLRQHESKKFKMYSIYAWGCPSLFSIFTYYMQTYFSSSIFYPALGERCCLFDKTLTKIIYFYGPIAILSALDLLMFLYTAVMIAKKIRDTKIINHPDCKRKIDHEKKRFVLYLKLFIVMGINWIAELLSFVIGKNDNGFTVWDITDFGNALQGVFIFLIFICKKRVLRLLCEKFCPNMNPFKKSTSTSTKTRYSSIISKTTTLS